jgi:hypothetical protein
MRNRRLHQLIARRDLSWKVGDLCWEKLDSKHICSRTINGRAHWGDRLLLRRTRINLAFTFLSSKAEQGNIQACCHFNIFTGTNNFLLFAVFYSFPSSITSCPLSISLTLFQIALRLFKRSTFFQSFALISVSSYSRGAQIFQKIV